jgi:hypothetical protein
MLRRAKYRLRFNRKRLTRRSSPDRNKQFTNINKLKESFAKRGQPVISVDAKKRELVGLFKNQGREWRKALVDVDMYDFPSDADGVAIPYGIYDVTRGDGFVVVGTPHNTSGFATNAVHTWWRRLGSNLYSAAKALLILADSGSSNGAKAHDWKHGLQNAASSRRICHWRAGLTRESIELTRIRDRPKVVRAPRPRCRTARRLTRGTRWAARNRDGRPGCAACERHRGRTGCIDHLCDAEPALIASSMASEKSTP